MKSTVTILPPGIITDPRPYERLPRGFRASDSLPGNDPWAWYSLERNQRGLTDLTGQDRHLIVNGVSPAYGEGFAQMPGAFQAGFDAQRFRTGLHWSDAIGGITVIACIRQRTNDNNAWLGFGNGGQLALGKRGVGSNFVYTAVGGSRTDRSAFAGYVAQMAPDGPFFIFACRINSTEIRVNLPGASTPLFAPAHGLDLGALVDEELCLHVNWAVAPGNTALSMSNFADWSDIALWNSRLNDGAVAAEMALCRARAEAMGLTVFPNP